MENVPTKSCRGDVGTWGRRHRCRQNRNRGNATLENTKGIGRPIPSTFVPTSPRLPGDVGAPLDHAVPDAQLIHFLFFGRRHHVDSVALVG